jgi:hypothetical protein
VRALIAALALLTVAEVRAAEPDLLVEIHVATRPIEMDLYLNHVARTEGSRPLLHGAGLRDRIDSRFGVVARDATEDEAQSLLRTVEQGEEAFLRGDFGAAITTLERAVGELAGRDALLARDRRARLALERGRLYLSQSYLRTSRPRDAAVVMAEVLRAAPGREPSPRTYSPELIKFHRRVRSDLDAQPRGHLKVVTRPEGADVFVGGEHVGRSPVRLPDLLPGRYRVVAQFGERRGRVHDVAVAGGAQEQALDLELDSALAQSDKPALVYADAESRTRLEVGHAAALGRLLGAREVILIGVGSQQGRAALLGTVVAVDSARTVRAGFVTLEPAAPDRSTLEAFGRFLRVGAPGPGVVVQVASPLRSDLPSGASRGSRLGWLRWVGLGVGLAATGAGAGLVAIDGRRTCSGPSTINCPERYHTLAGGAALVAIGGAAIIGSGLALILRWGDARRVAVAPQPGGLLASFSTGF